MTQSPIQFDRASGALVGANPWERLAAVALTLGSKISSNFSHRGYNMCANLLRKALPERDIDVRLNADATFAFPYGDGYWSKLLNRSFAYENELELLFQDSADIDYTLLDCGANYGYWSVLVSSAPYGSHKAIAIEPSSQNFAKLKNNAEINGNLLYTIQEVSSSVTVASELHARACELVDARHKSVSALEKELSETQAREMAIQSQLDVAILAVKRLGNFRPMLGPDHQCPDCFIKHETRSTLRPIPGSATHDLFRCETCLIELSFQV